MAIEYKPLNQNRMEQTAVEFAVEQLEKFIPEGNQIAIYAILEKAKEMEKENTINFAIQYMFGRTDIGSNLRNDFIQKYNETFKSE
jgi:hypothetical protein